MLSRIRIWRALTMEVERNVYKSSSCLLAGSRLLKSFLVVRPISLFSLSKKQTWISLQPPSPRPGFCPSFLV